MSIDKETQVCISIAEKPGNLGATIFNDTFQKLSLNYIYKPFKVERRNLQKAVSGIRVFGIRGCGISMPHKISVMKYLDKVDVKARKVGAVNTIVNDKGKLTGFNTDFEAAKIVTSLDFDVRGKDVFIAGCGGVARSIIKALQENGARSIVVTNRSTATGKSFAKEFNVNFLPWKKRNEVKGDLLINATPLGMLKKDTCPFRPSTVERFTGVLDVVVSSKDTPLISSAKRLRRITISGVRLSVLQAIAQFKLYTGKDLPIKVVEESISNYLRKR